MTDTQQNSEDIIRLTTLNNLDEQLCGVVKEVFLQREGYGDERITKDRVEQLISREWTEKKLISDGFNPIKLKWNESHLCQNMEDKKLVINPELRNEKKEDLKSDVITMEFHNNCIPLIQNYMSAPENNSYSFKHAGWQHNFKFYWPQAATNKICFIGRNSNYDGLYCRCDIVDVLNNYYECSHINTDGTLVVDDYRLYNNPNKVLYIDPFNHAAFDSGLEILGTLAHKKSFEDFIAGMKSGVEKFMLQLGGYKYKEYFKYLKTAYDNDYIFCFCETLPDIVVADTPEFRDWYVAVWYRGLAEYKREKITQAQVKDFILQKGTTETNTRHYENYNKFIDRVSPLVHAFLTKEQYPNDYAEYFKKVKGPGKFGTALDLSTPKAVRDALPAVKKYCKCVLADRAFLTDILFPAPDERDVDYRGRPRNCDKIKDFRWDKLYIARDDATDSTLACATVILTTLSALNPNLVNPGRPPIVQLLATGKYKKNTGRDLVPLGGQIQVSKVVDITKVRPTKAALGYF